MAQLAKPGRLHVQAGRGGHCWVIMSRLNTVFWPTAEDPLEDLLPGTNQYQSSGRLICEPPSTVGIDYDQIHHSLAGVELFSTISRVQRA